jgi:hypothetical protein
MVMTLVSFHSKFGNNQYKKSWLFKLFNFIGLSLLTKIFIFKKNHLAWIFLLDHLTKVFFYYWSNVALNQVKQQKINNFNIK